MKIVNVTFNGPIMENLCSVTISDGVADCQFHLDNEEVENARETGPSDLLYLVVENMDSDGLDILNAAVENGSRVIVDGADFPVARLRSALSEGGAFPKA